MSAVTRVVIVGRDAALWLSANALHKALGGVIEIEVVELPGLVRAQDVYATLPALEAFHGLLGIDEHALLKAARGSFTLGQSFVNFSGPLPPFFHPYGSAGIAIDQVPFLQFLTKARQNGLSVAYEDFSLTAAAAKQGRFVVPDEATETFGRTDYGYHLPAIGYVAFLKQLAVRSGLKTHTARAVMAERDGAGDIVAVDTDGKRIDGDFFIDASGTESVLLRGALEGDFISWRHRFAADRVLSVAAPRLKSLPPYSQVRALNNGWLGLYAAQDATRLSYVYGSQWFGDDQALRDAATVSGLTLGDAVVSPLSPGHGAALWLHNCVAIGEAACVLDPSDNAGLQTVQLGLSHLIALFPLDRARQPERVEYNRRMQLAFDNIGDFQMLHRVCNLYRGSRFWDAARQVPWPDSLKARTEAWRATGSFVLNDEESFEADSWNALLLGHGLQPEGYDARVDLTSEAALAGHLRQMLGFIRSQVEAMHGHDAYLEIFCSA